MVMNLLSLRPELVGILVALLFEEVIVMTLVTDNFAVNQNPTPKQLQMFKTLSATAVSGSAVTDTEAFYTKDCPFPIKVVGFEVQSISVSGGGFSGSGSNLTVALQSSDEVDTSPGAPTSVVWDTITTVDASGSAQGTDKMLFSAPGNVSGLLNPSLDQTYVAVPEGGSLRATLSAQARDSIAAGSTPVELLAVVHFIPTAWRDQRFN